MKNKAHYTEQQIEYAMQAIKNPSLRNSEEFLQWLENADNKALFLELMVCSEAVDRTHKHLPIHHSSKRARTVWRILPVATAAAIALLLIAYLSFPSEVPAPQKPFFAAIKAPEGIILQRGGEAPVLLHDSLMDMHTLATNTDTVEYFTLTIPRGKDFKLVLSDGTEVWLNAESTLRYPARFIEQERRVELTGEAFFHVSRNETQPFIVQTTDLETRVLGTQFNVRSYQNEIPHVTLVSGSVKVRKSHSSGEGTLLQPGQDICYTTNGEEIAYVNLDTYTAWTEGLFYFEDAPLKEIMRTLGRWYNIDILFDEVLTENFLFNFWADRNAPIEETIKLLNKVGNIHATIRNGIIHVNHL